MSRGSSDSQDPDGLRTFDQVFCSVPRYWNFSPDYPVVTAFRDILSRVRTVTMTYQHGWWPWTPGWGSYLSGFAPVKLFSSSLPSILLSLGGSDYVQRPPEEGVGSHAPRLEGGVVTQALWDSSAQNICLYSSFCLLLIGWFEFVLLRYCVIKELFI